MIHTLTKITVNEELIKSGHFKRTFVLDTRV